MMPRRLSLAALIVLAILVPGCQAQRVIIIENVSSRQLRVLVSAPGGIVSSVSPEPGGEATVVVERNGAYRAAAVAEAEWLAALRFRRDFLTRQLADSQSRRRLSASERQAIADQIGELARQLERASEAASDDLQRCAAEVTSDGGTGRVRITDDAGGYPGFVLTCT